MKVIAKDRGYFGSVRNVGDVFEVPDDTIMLDAWFDEVKEEPKRKPEKSVEK